MYNVDIYTDNHDRCGDILVPGKTQKNFSWIAGLLKTV
jgi:hypothetical protein